ncbi:hypothetical protein CIPAW_11G002300 [Carya illinoinensis]|uniref:Uncharacterized protein n=1 Tax=Carya illinoinensis TaxID=32201 RepID=A0A8T1NZR4_CARIL|nr:hypothetical protein CIPAW_11G002300 [Carya illinoinensis]
MKIKESCLISKDDLPKSTVGFSKLFMSGDGTST